MNPRSILFRYCLIFFLLPPFTHFDFFKVKSEADTAISKNKVGKLMEICDNGIDDDGDGLVDCFDDDCFGTVECEDFYYGPGSVDPCTFVPPVVPEFELELLYQTDGDTYPIDQRVGAFVGDMDGDGIPEIITHNTNPGKVYIFNGEDGTIQQEIDAPNSSVFHQMAIADVDSDGNGDIFYIENGRALIRYEAGNPLPVWQTAAAQVRASYIGVHVADFDGDGTPEVYVGSRIFNSADGTRLAVGTGNYGRYASSDSYTLAYDIFKPGDPKPGGGVFGAEAAGLELLAGNQVYTVELGDGTADNGTLTVVSELNATALEGDGFVSIGDIDCDGKIDLLIMDGGRVYVWDPRTETQIGDTYQIFNTTGGGRINVGDFDNDGKAEFGTAGRNIYVVLEYDPVGDTLAELWTKPGVDDGSQRTGSSLFDFEGDGSAEVVYSEEGHLFVLNGATGAELAKLPSEAGTRTEYPLVADVNGDGAAEIIVTAQVGNGPGASGGDDYVSVYRSKSFPWVSARPVWNQHGYFNTNINDDLTVPAVQQDILNPALGTTFNAFLTQTTILAGGDPAFAAPDATMEILSMSLDSCPKVETQMKIKNLGSAILPAVTPIAFYNNDPTMVAATLLDVSTIGVNIAEGDSATITHAVCIPSPLTTPLLIYAVVNDTGFTAVNLPYDFEDDFPVTSVPECDFTNNLDRKMSGTCVEICGDGKDNDGDGLADEPNITAPDTTGCSGDVLAQMTADLPMGTWSIISSIGSTISPTGVVTLGTNHSSTPDFDTVIYALAPCPDTILVSTLDDEDPIIICPNNQTIDCESTGPTGLLIWDHNEAGGTSYAGVNNITEVISGVNDISFGAGLQLLDNNANPAVIPNGSNYEHVLTDAATSNYAAAKAANDYAEISFTTSVTGMLTQIQEGLIPTAWGGSAAGSFKVAAEISYDGFANSYLLYKDVQMGDPNAIGGYALYQEALSYPLMAGQNYEVRFYLYDEQNNANMSNGTPLPDNTVAFDDLQLTIEGTDVANNTISLSDWSQGAIINDNCSEYDDLTITQTPAPGTTLGFGTTTVTITVEDEAGHTTQCTFTVTLDDDEDPNITCPANQNITVDGSCEYELADFTDATVSDNCSANADIEVTQSPPIDTTLTDHNTSQIVTLTAEDEAGNTAECTFTITLKDETDPVITCPANQDITADSDCEYDLADFTNVTTSDNCSLSANIDVTQSPAIGSTLSGTGANTITLTAEDEAGNTKDCSFTITLKDETDPTITCPANQDLAVGNNCFATVPDYTDDATIADNCSAATDITVTQDPAVGTILATIGSTHTITLTAEDEAGNTEDCTFTITLTDETDPAIFCPANTTINVDGNCEYDIADFTGAVATDNCSAAADIDITQAPTAGTTISGHGTTQTVTLTAEDEAGNTKDCTFDITLNDNSDPTITCPANQTLIANADCEVTIGDYTSATVSDNCTAAGSIAVTQSPVSGTTIAGTTTVTLTANDGNGNTKDCTFNILIDDDTDPTITCPANADVTVNGDCEYVLPDLTGGATVDDNCTASTSISISQNPAVGSTLSGHNTTQTITLTANDGNGNTEQCTFDITLKDESDPSILCPSTQDVFVDGDCEFDIPDYTGASVDDNCTADASITVTQAPIAGTTLSAHNTTQTITLTANDGNGNTADCTFDITLKDNTQPSITCPGTQTLVPNADCEITLPDYTSATVDDNCTAAASIMVTQSPAIGTMLAPSGGSATVTLTADDGNGNTVDCSFSIDFGDISPPSITCPADTIRDLNANCQYTIEDFTDKAIVADNCAATADIDVTQSPIAGIVLTGAGTVQSITLTADDGNGNTANCSFNVALGDTTSPAITCPLNADLMVDNNCEVLIIDYTSSATSTDNCSAPSNIIITQNPLAGTTLSGNGTTQTITLTATDESGNTKDCEFEITVLDETDPSIICPVNQTVDLDANCEYILGDFTGMATLADNCTPAGVITVTQSPTPLTVFENEPSVETITITADDNNGGVVTCTFELTIQDVTDPIITCPDELDKNLNGDCEYTLEDLSGLVIGANECSDDNDLTITQTPAAGTVFDNVPISQMITLTAEDDSGNSTFCQIEINLIDEIPPTVICPDNKIETGAGCDLEIVNYLSEVSITDNCSILGDMTITQNPAAGTVLATGVHTITITVEDESGNEASCAFVLELQLDPPTMPEIGGN